MKKLYHIQALRGMAASLVVVAHALQPVVDNGVLSDFDKVRWHIGGIGVSVFFVISGFIMVATSYNMFGSGANSFAFYTRRLVRIVPIYWIATLIAVAAAVTHGSFLSVEHLLYSLLFIPDASTPGGSLQPVLGPGWTLNYEMFFYGLFAVALLFPRKYGLLLLFLAFVGIVAAGTIVRPFSDTRDPRTIASFLAHPMILLFAAGMAIGIFQRNNPVRILFKYPFAIVCCIIGLTIGALIVFNVKSPLPFPRMALIWLPCIFCVFVCVFNSSARGGRMETIVEGFGDASYSTYLFHLFVLSLISRIFPPTTPSSAVFFVIVAVVAANLTGMAVYVIAERPITERLRLMTGRSGDKKIEGHKTKSFSPEETGSC